MGNEKINSDYLGMWKELIPFAKILIFGSSAPAGASAESKNILIVNTCLIGDFMVSVRAIRDFIERNSDKNVDIIVSPPLKPLAEKLIGLRRVFTAKSIYARNLENYSGENNDFGAYEKIIVMRTSPQAYQMIKNIPAARIETGLGPLLRYGLHVGMSLVRGRPPESLREVNSKVLKGKLRNMSFENMFRFDKKDHDAVARLLPRPNRRKLIIHTGATSWIMKRWDNKKWAELLRRIHENHDLDVIFVGSKGDETDYEYISPKLGFETYSLIGRIDLAELILTLRMSDYFIGIDSGPANMADLTATKSIFIMGPGPHLFRPLNEKIIVIDKSRGRGLYQMYFHKNNGFTEKISVEEVYRAFETLARN